MSRPRITPRRGLPDHFTQQTLAKTLAAHPARRRLKLSIDSRSFVLHPALTALLIFVLLGTSSVGAYGVFHNWFGGKATVHREGEIITIRLENCPSGPGISTGLAKNASGVASFKIVKPDTPTQPRLQQLLMGDCELQAVQAFYMQNLPVYAAHMQGDFSDGTLLTLLSGKVERVGADTITITYVRGAEQQTETFALANAATIFAAREPYQKERLRPDDFIVFAGSQQADIAHGQQTVSVTPNGDITILSIFKTSLDTRQSLSQQGLSFDDLGVEPLAQP